MKDSFFRSLCQAPAGRMEVLQGNIAFAVGCVRAGIHSADGYPGTPSTEVIDRGLSQVQDMITVGWSVNEAVAVGVAYGHTLAGRDAVVTMKIPGLFQAGDVFTSSSFFHQPRGVLIYYIASDFTPSSTQHVIDPRPFLKSCRLPVFEPADHQQMLDAASIAVKIGRQHNTPVVILASGNLCHSEGLVRFNPIQRRNPVLVGDDLREFNCLPGMARKNYDMVMGVRMPALEEMAENSPLNTWIHGTGRTGIITSGANAAFVKEVNAFTGGELDILSLAFTNPLPRNRIREFFRAIRGPVHVIEDGCSFLADALQAMGLSVISKPDYSPITEYTPTLVAETIGRPLSRRQPPGLPPFSRPPMICAGCPYRLFAGVVSKLKARGKLAAVFGDIGCNSLLYFMGAMDTGVAMGASESKRTGFVLSRPDMADKVISILGDSTECHSGMDATRNAVFRKVPGVKVVLDNRWTAMTGGQPAPTSPVNLAGDPLDFDLVQALSTSGAKTVAVNAYDRKAIQQALRNGLKDASAGVFSAIVVQGNCIKKVPGSQKGIKLKIDTEKCDRCETCMICPGIEKGPEGYPQYTNLCSGCGDQDPACRQMCPFGAIEVLDRENVKTAAVPRLAAPPEIEAKHFDRPSADFPAKLSLAIRGVGGQGNLFFGRVLTQLAFQAGYGSGNIIKGETHGMAQMGGPVISTFACGNVYSPVLLPGSADCLIAMEISELLRPGFLEMLRKGGTVLAAKTTIVPQNLPAGAYPDVAQIKDSVGACEFIEVDVLGSAQAMGDITGRTGNVVMLGALSRVAPFDTIPETLWLKALKSVSPKAELWAANYHAFEAGRKLLG
jgi:indolepyruvate ferredoxin oxidoreductase, alpha subunit